MVKRDMKNHIIKTVKFLNCLIIALFLFSTFGLAGRWERVPINTEYYKDEFNKPYIHLGIGFTYGGAYYMNIEEYNTYPKYIISFRIAPEIQYYKLGFLFKMSILLESKDFTDEINYYSSRFKFGEVSMVGVNMKFPSPIPLVSSLKPYFIIGGGIFEINYEHMYLDSNRNLINYDVYTDGIAPVIGFSLGSEVELIKSLLYLDLGLNYLYTFGIKPQRGDETTTDEDAISEIELDYYAGFIFNLF